MNIRCQIDPAQAQTFGTSAARRQHRIGLLAQRCVRPTRPDSLPGYAGKAQGRYHLWPRTTVQVLVGQIARADLGGAQFQALPRPIRDAADDFNAPLAHSNSNLAGRVCIGLRTSLTFRKLAHAIAHVTARCDRNSTARQNRSWMQRAAQAVEKVVAGSLTRVPGTKIVS